MGLVYSGAKATKLLAWALDRSSCLRVFMVNLLLDAKWLKFSREFLRRAVR